MCGGCTRAVGHDRWSAVLSSTRARQQATGALNTFLCEIGHHARVVAVPGAWTVTTATGRSVITDTATGLWAAVRAAGEVDRGAVDRLRRAARSVETIALAEAATLASGAAVDP